MVKQSHKTLRASDSSFSVRQEATEQEATKQEATEQEATEQEATEQEATTPGGPFKSAEDAAAGGYSELYKTIFQVPSLINKWVKANECQEATKVAYDEYRARIEANEALLMVHAYQQKALYALASSNVAWQDLANNLIACLSPINAVDIPVV